MKLLSKPRCLFQSKMACVLSLALTQTAFADLFLEFDQSTYNVTNGQTIDVTMRLRDTDGSTPLMAEGLGSGGGRVMIDSTTGSINLTNSGVTPNADWDTSTDAPAGTPGDELAAFLGGEIFGPGVGVGSTIVNIATFSITVTGSLGDVATINADLLQNGLIANETFTSFTDLDAILAGDEVNFPDTTIAITAVPEPGTLLLGSMTFMMIGVGAWRRRQRRNRSKS